MRDTIDEFGTPYDQTSFPNKVDKEPPLGLYLNRPIRTTDFGVKDICEIPAAKPGQGAKI